MAECSHRCCAKTAPGRTNTKKAQKRHTHTLKPGDCPSCYIAGYRLQRKED